jgi:hypothetical protein
MSFEAENFSSVNNQPLCGERAQIWQYETADPVADLEANNYFGPAAPSLQKNDLILVRQYADAGLEQLVRRYDLIVRAKEEENGPKRSVLVALVDVPGKETDHVVFEDITTSSLQPIVPDKSSGLAEVTAIVLDHWEGAEAVTIVVKTTSGTPATVATANISAPMEYGTAVSVPVTVDTEDTAFTVGIAPVGFSHPGGRLEVFVQYT